MNGADVLSDRELGRSTEIRIKYEGYIRREAELAQRLVELESRKVPEGLDYSRVPGLSNEAKAKLDRLRPRSLAQVSRISGITPSDVTILFYYLAKGGYGV
jgi:tRNA uridine 5-carboxymethylaminomethyl modification enzyme